MERLGRVLQFVPDGIVGMVLVFVLISCLVLWFLVPFMIYSICYRIKSIEWNINYLLFGDKKKSIRNIKGDRRDNIVYWVLAIVEERQKERIRREERKRDELLAVERKKKKIKVHPLSLAEETQSRTRPS